MIYFTSDTHYDHQNIIKYCERPYKNTGEMIEGLIDSWNSVISPSDTVYHLGDVMMGNEPLKLEKIMARLHGIKHLILGNHDRIKPFTYIECGFSSVHTSLKLADKLYLCHDPSAKNVLKDDDILVCGHVHNLFKTIKEQNVVNVGVDVWDYKPVSMEAVLEELK